jgi:hypothetical protein
LYVRWFIFCLSDITVSLISIHASKSDAESSFVYLKIFSNYSILSWLCGSGRWKGENIWVPRLYLC